MKKLSLLTAIVLAATVGIIGCVDTGVTELAFKNRDTSSGPINDIVWVEDDIQWTKGTDGYATNETTESKEVDSLTSSVDCTVDPDGLGFVAATVSFPAMGGSNTLSLEEATSYVYSLEATPAK